jgi:uncharacterized protein YkwD
VKHFLSLWLIPQERNNYRAFVLHPSIISFLIVFYLLNQSILKSLTILKPGILGYSSEITSQKVYILTNLERQKLNLPPLKYNSLLSRSATTKADDMFINNYWSHNSPRGKSPWDFFRSVGYHYSLAGENLAKDFADTENLVRAWMNSPTHRENIINPRFQEIGIAVVSGTLNGLRTTLVVEHFASPAVGYITTAEHLIPQRIAADPNILSSTAIQRVFNPLVITKTIGLVMFGLIITVLLIDSLLTFRHHTYRLSGSTLGHISFLAIILLLIIFTRQGSVF